MMCLLPWNILLVSVVYLHPLWVCPTLHPVCVVTLNLHLFINLLEHLPNATPAVELLLSVLLASEGDAIPHLCDYIILGPVLSTGRRQGKVCHSVW